MAVSLGVRLGDGFSARCKRLIGHPAGTRRVVLYYHAVSAGQRARFARQMDELLRLAQPLCAEALDARDPARNGCAVTFDDGFESVAANALPELERRGIPVTLFVPTGCLGGRPSWITNPSAAAYRETVMSERQLVSLRNRPLVSIGSHTVSHPRLPGLNDDALAREMCRSKADLEAILGREVDLLSFPHGAFDERVLAMARQAGYRRGFSIAPTCVSDSTDAFVVGRVAANPEDSLMEFRAKLLGAWRWLARRGDPGETGRVLRPRLETAA